MHRLYDSDPKWKRKGLWYATREVTRNHPVAKYTRQKAATRKSSEAELVALSGG